VLDKDSDILYALLSPDRTILRGFRQMTVILLATLKAHPQPSVVAFAQILVNAANTLPRSNNTTTYPTELAFVAAHARWRDGFKAQVTAFTRGRERSGGWLEFENEDDVEDDSMEQLSAEDLTEQAQNFENFFMGITNLLLGDADKVLLESQDWIAAMAIWGVLVEPTLKRDDLP
jgi:nuclear pore complex protein Nup85